MTKKDKQKYFQYAVLAYEKTKEGWVTEILVELKTVLSTSEKTVYMTAVKQIQSDDLEKYGAENVDIIIRPF